MRTDCADGSDEQLCVSCDFESNECGWRITPGDYDWVRVHPGDYSWNQPPNDTTLGNSSGKLCLFKIKKILDVEHIEIVLSLI